MSSLGSYLRELRQRRGASIDEVSRATRVASQYLQALEADDHTTLPAPVFIRGFIRAYCQFLGEPPDEALARYAGRTADAADPMAPANGPAAAPPVVVAATASSAPAEREARGRGAVLVSFVLLIVLGLALFAVTMALNSGRDGAAHRRSAGTEADPAASRSAVEAPPPAAVTPPAVPAVRPTPPAPDPRGAASAKAPAPEKSAPPSAVASWAPAPDVPAARPAPEKAPAATEEKVVANVPAAMLQPFVGSVTSPYRLVARTTEPTWIRVRTQDGRSIEETVPAGETREWLSNSPFTLTVGNAGGIALELNGRALPPLGGRGVVIQRLVLPPPQQ